jgi:hypothetical protein
MCPPRGGTGRVPFVTGGKGAGLLGFAPRSEAFEARFSSQSLSWALGSLPVEDERSGPHGEDQNHAFARAEADLSVNCVRRNVAEVPRSDF